MRSVVKYIVEKTYKPLLVKYLATARTYSWKGIVLEIPPEVFHPGFFYSTKILLRFLSHKNLKGKKFLELGAGSGLISIDAARKGAKVTATDINPVAIHCVRKNAALNRAEIDVVQSDLFDQIPMHHFDTIVINPPYYKKQPVSNADYAWFCGEQGEYFQKLFQQLNTYIHENSEVLMTLCDACDLEMIRGFAKQHAFSLHLVYSKKSVLEENYIFKIEKANGR